MNSFGKKLIKLRKENGLSQEALADKLGVSRQSISKWEIGMAIPRSSKVNKLCKIFDISADELFDNKKVDNENKEENPVASDKKKFNFKVMLKCIAIILIILLVLHLIYAVYKFCVLNYVTNKVAQYKNLDNYYCHIRTYETDDIYESTEIWYKDQKYKIITTYYGNDEKDNQYVTKWIDCDKKEAYIKNENSNRIESLNLETNIFDSYKDGNFFYNDIPSMIKNTKKINLLISLKLNLIVLKNRSKFIELRMDNKILKVEKGSYNSISYSELKKINKNLQYIIKYYELKTNAIVNENLKIE